MPCTGGTWHASSCLCPWLSAWYRLLGARPRTWRLSRTTTMSGGSGRRRCLGISFGTAAAKWGFAWCGEGRPADRVHPAALPPMWLRPRLPKVVTRECGDVLGAPARLVRKGEGGPRHSAFPAFPPGLCAPVFSGGCAPGQRGFGGCAPGWRCFGGCAPGWRGFGASAPVPPAEDHEIPSLRSRALCSGFPKSLGNRLGAVLGGAQGSMIGRPGALCGFTVPQEAAGEQSPVLAGGHKLLGRGLRDRSRVSPRECGGRRCPLENDPEGDGVDLHALGLGCRAPGPGRETTVPPSWYCEGLVAYLLHSAFGCGLPPPSLQQDLQERLARLLEVSAARPTRRMRHLRASQNRTPAASA